MTAAERIRAMTGPRWLLLFAVILAAWVMLWLMAVSAEGPGLGQTHGFGAWVALGSATADKAGLLPLAGMWSLMSAAMMAPSALPAFATWDDLTRAGAGGRAAFGALVAGYLAVWVGFSLLAAGAQMALFAFGALSPRGASLSPWFSAGLLAFAGAYQLSSLKAACLSRCRQPLTFFIQYWRGGRTNAAAMGVRLGLVCLGCCWALMLLGFVGGVMNLAFMALATVLMTLEKLPSLGRYVSRPLAWGLLGWAGVTAASAAGFI